MGQAWGFGKHGGPEVQEFFDRPDPVPGRVSVETPRGAGSVR